jgi:predicted RNA binding protein YcfA (HicA-like mRNA interferase family)
MTVKELLKTLKKDGWIEKEQKGSHRQLVHHTKKEK